MVASRLQYCFMPRFIALLMQWIISSAFVCHFLSPWWCFPRPKACTRANTMLFLRCFDLNCTKICQWYAPNESLGGCSSLPSLFTTTISNTSRTCPWERVCVLSIWTQPLTHYKNGRKPERCRTQNKTAQLFTECTTSSCSPIYGIRAIFAYVLPWSKWMLVCLSFASCCRHQL